MNQRLREVVLPDSNDIDAFGRLRVSNPQGLFDAQFTYDLATLQYERLESNGGAGTATVTHDATNRCALMTLSGANSGAYARMQSFEFVRYQPGRSQAGFVTFAFGAAVAGVTRSAGLSDGVNGIELVQTANGVSLVLRSATGLGTQTVAQADWDDPMDGTGASGLTLDLTKTQILVMDFQALYVGRVRVGFDIDGVIVPAHSFLHANGVTLPYIQYASLPVRVGMTATANGATATMRFICAAVLSEGGQEENGGIPFSVEGTVTAASGTDTHILSVRPLTTFNSIQNRAKVILDSVDLLVTGNQPVLWKLVAGQALTAPSFAAVNATYSAVEAHAGAGTLSGSPAVVIQQGYVAASATTKSASNPRVAGRIPITLDAAGAVRALGTITVLVQGIGGTSACRAVLNWRELR